jgi:hypothetical protein
MLLLMEAGRIFKGKCTLFSEAFCCRFQQRLSSHDFSMILGNPGSTSRYLTSFGVNSEWRPAIRHALMSEVLNRLFGDHLCARMKQSTLLMPINMLRVPIIGKNSIGMNKAIQKLNVVERKKEQEAEFLEWVKSNPANEKKYKDALKTLEDGYATLYSLCSSTQLFARIADEWCRITQNSPEIESTYFAEFAKRFSHQGVRRNIQGLSSGS